MNDKKELEEFAQCRSAWQDVEDLLEAYEKAVHKAVKMESEYNKKYDFPYQRRVEAIGDTSVLKSAQDVFNLSTCKLFNARQADEEALF